MASWRDGMVVREVRVPSGDREWGLSAFDPGTRGIAMEFYCLIGSCYEAI